MSRPSGITLDFHWRVLLTSGCSGRVRLQNSFAAVRPSCAPRTFLYEAGKLRVKSLKYHLISWLRRSNCPQNHIWSSGWSEVCRRREHLYLMRSGLGSLTIFWDWLRLQGAGSGRKETTHEWSEGEACSVGNVAASESLASCRVSDPQMDRKHSQMKSWQGEVVRLCEWVQEVESGKILWTKFCRTSMGEALEEQKVVKGCSQFSFLRFSFIQLVSKLQRFLSVPFCHVFTPTFLLAPGKILG